MSLENVPWQHSTYPYDCNGNGNVMLYRDIMVTSHNGGNNNNGGNEESVSVSGAAIMQAAPGTTITTITLSFCERLRSRLPPETRGVIDIRMLYHVPIIIIILLFKQYSHYIIFFLIYYSFKGNTVFQHQT